MAQQIFNLISIIRTSLKYFSLLVFAVLLVISLSLNVSFLLSMLLILPIIGTLFFILQGRNKLFLLFPFCLLILSIEFCWLQRIRDLNELKNAQVYRLPEFQSGNKINWLVPERDLAIVLGSILKFSTSLFATNKIDLLPNLVSCYDRFFIRNGEIPSPLIAGLFNLSNSHNFDTVLLKSDRLDNVSSRKAIVFLHGFGGNWTLVCYMISEAGIKNKYDTFCPSGEIGGDWSGSRGNDTLNKTLNELVKVGYQDIVLIGMSNGGASLLKLLQEEKITQKDVVKGVVTIFSGFKEKQIQKPLLEIYKDGVEQIEFTGSDGFKSPNAEMNFSSSKQIHIKSSNFGIFEKESEINEAITKWLDQLESEMPYDKIKTQFEMVPLNRTQPDK